MLQKVVSLLIVFLTLRRRVLCWVPVMERKNLEKKNGRTPVFQAKPEALVEGSRNESTTDGAAPAKRGEDKETCEATGSVEAHLDFGTYLEPIVLRGRAPDGFGSPEDIDSKGASQEKG